jgi:hypothetical protein
VANGIRNIAVRAAEPTPEKIKAFLDACERERPRKIAGLEKQISALSSRLKQNGKKASLQSKTNLANMRKSLTDLKSHRTLAIPQLQVPFIVGDMGYAPGAGIGQLFQVVDEKQMLVNFDWGDLTFLVLVRGMSTANRADETKIQLGGVFEVSGTYKYGTAIGSKTVMVLEPFDAEAAKDAVGKEKQAAAKK